MDKHTIFATWAPPVSPWSPWAKPTLFSHLTPEAHNGADLVPYDVSSLPPAAERCAVVVDLPGVDSVRMALALAARGYRPVPLFNACPATQVVGELVLTAVEVEPILHAICFGAAALAHMPLSAEAPPAFLLDGNRSECTRVIDSVTFDNRSVVFASDFPSAAFLRNHKVNRCLLVHPSGRPVDNDLRHALRHWGAAGLPLAAISPTGERIEVSWPRNGFLGELAVRLFASLRLRRNPLGGFGALVPETSGG